MPQTTEYVYAKHGLLSAQGFCTRNFNKSMDFELGSFSSLGIYRLGSGEKCDLVDLNPDFLHRHFKRKTIVFVGDSHVRNLFTAFVAEVRNQRLVVERHVDQYTKQALSPFQVFNFNAERDEFKDLTGSNTDALLQVTTACREAEESSGCCGVQVLFLWAGFVEDYEQVLRGAMRKIKPDVIITNVLSKSYSEPAKFEDAMRQNFAAFDKYFTETKEKPTKLVIAPFPLHGGDLVLQRIKEWLLTGAVNKANTMLVNQSQFIKSFTRSGGKLKQLESTSHSVCALYDTYSLEPGKREKDEGGVKIAGYEPCTAPLDRAIVRAAFTFAFAS